MPLVVHTLTAVQHGRAQHVVALADFSQHAYRFVDSGLIVLELSEEGDLASGRIQDLPDAVEILRRALAQSIGGDVGRAAQRAGAGGQRSAR